MSREHPGAPRPVALTVRYHLGRHHLQGLKGDLRSREAETRALEQTLDSSDQWRADGPEYRFHSPFHPRTQAGLEHRISLSWPGYRQMAFELVCYHIKNINCSLRKL